jgi:hypothetical protein
MVTETGTAHQAGLLNAALAYAARGWSVIPTRGKVAAVCWTTYQTCRPNGAFLRGAFSLPGVDGVGVILGRVSGGLACRDFDLEDSYFRWKAKHHDLAKKLPTVETHRGFHIYHRGPEAYQDLSDGEFRGDAGHYCLLPPSRHPSGSTYHWVVPLPNEPLPVLNPHEAGLVPTPLQVLDTSSSATVPSCSAESAGSIGGVSALSALSALHGSSSSVPSQERDRALEQLIRSTLPAGPGRRQRAIFDLVRGLKAIPHFVNADPRDLEPILRRWHKLALPTIRTKPFEESRGDFLRAWPLAKYPAGAGPLHALWALALAEPAPPEALRYEQEEVRRLVALCYQLQGHAGADSFPLPCRTAAELLGVGPATAWRWLQLLELDGVLIRTFTGSKASGRANEYRYNVSNGTAG